MINRKVKILITTAVFTVVFSIYGCAPLKPVEPENCRRIDLAGAPEDISFVSSGDNRWLVMVTADRVNKSTDGFGHVYLLPLGDDGAPGEDLKRFTLSECPDKTSVCSTSPAGFHIAEASDAVRTMVIVNRAIDDSQETAFWIDKLNVDFETGAITHLDSLPIVNDKGANDVAINTDGHILASTPNLMTRSDDTLIVHDGVNWRNIDIELAFSNGIIPLNDSWLVADFHTGTVNLINTTNDDQLMQSFEIEGVHPDNFSLSSDGKVHLAAHNSEIMSFLHILSPRFRAGWDVYEIQSMNRNQVSARLLKDVPRPRGAQAVSTAVRVDDWWYYGQIIKPALFACKVH